MKVFSGVFASVMGMLMIIVWIVLIATGQHDFQSTPFESSSLLAAEALTALTLVVGGIAILMQKPWGFPVHLASLGMMLYTSVNSIGVFAQAGVMPASIFFTVLTLATILLIVIWAFRSFRERQADLSTAGARA